MDIGDRCYIMNGRGATGVLRLLHGDVAVLDTRATAAERLCAELNAEYLMLTQKPVAA